MVYDNVEQKTQADMMARPSIEEVVAERVYQEGVWAEHNRSNLLCLDEYIGVALRYLGGSTISYRNAGEDKRKMLIKAAAVILQAVDHIDNGNLVLGRAHEVEGSRYLAAQTQGT
ncbi:MAG: hypothetical protein AAF608_05240 [Pseudomonadota bacterium]